MSKAFPRRILFRCKFGGEEGWGHVVRCSALASVFRRNGWETCLWGKGAIDLLPEDVSKAFSRLTEDGTEASSVLVVDEMYTTDSELMQVVEEWRLRNGKGVVLGIDDMQRRSMAAFDLVVNAELGLRESEYASGVSLLGERFSLLRPGFAEPDCATVDIETADDAYPVFVMIGGTDAYGHLDTVLEVLGNAEKQVVPIVVEGERATDESCLRGFQDYRVLKGLGAGEIAAWMSVAKFAVIGCGSSVYEVAALNLPFVGLSLVDNQTATARRIAGLWKQPIVYCEDRQLNREALAEAVSFLFNSGSVQYSEVDTMGAVRVYERVLALLEARANQP